MTDSSWMIDPEVEEARRAAYKAKCNASISEGQRLLARIRPTSKYFGQGKEGHLFPVAVVSSDEYGVIGGPGGQYRLRDVDLFVILSEEAEPIQVTFDQSTASWG